VGVEDAHVSVGGGCEDTHVGCRNQTVSRDKIVARWQLHTSWLRCGRGRGHGRRRGRRLTVSEEAKGG
jgi:hypothetical protein